tara:strand:+ start:113 stop:412 length:300 start_codon:yes stop_codon:yes gene_type:complete
MAQFATTFGSQETKAKAKTRGASYSHRFISRPFLVQSFDAGNGTTLNLMRDGDDYIVVTIVGNRMAGPPKTYKGKRAEDEANRHIATLRAVFQASERVG